VVRTNLEDTSQVQNIVTGTENTYLQIEINKKVQKIKTAKISSQQMRTECKKTEVRALLT